MLAKFPLQLAWNALLPYAACRFAAWYTVHTASLLFCNHGGRLPCTLAKRPLVYYQSKGLPGIITFQGSLLDFNRSAQAHIH